jgi:hypothetical protein
MGKALPRKAPPAKPAQEIVDTVIDPGFTVRKGNEEDITKKKLGEGTP